MVELVSILIAGFYVAMLWRGRKKPILHFKEQSILLLRRVNYFTGILLLLFILLYFILNKTIAGAWTVPIILNAFFISGILFFHTSGAIQPRRAARIYFRSIFYLPVFCVALLLIPFLGASVVGKFALMFSPTPTYYEDSKIKIVENFAGVMSPPRTDVIKKEGLVEERLLSLRQDHFDSVTVKYDGDSAICSFHSTIHGMRDTVDGQVGVKL